MKPAIQHIKTMKHRSFLLLAAAVWGLGTVFMKGVVEDVSPFWLASTRFFSAGVILSIAFAPKLVRLAHEGRLADHSKAALIVGVPMMAGYMLNAFGLVGTTAAKSSFLTGLYCVIVPFVSWMVTRRRPTVFNISAAVLCVAGIAFVSLVGSDSLSMGWGDAVTLLSAAFMAVQLALTPKVAPGRDMMSITALSFLLAGGASIGVAALIEPAPSPASFMQPEMLSSIVYLVVFATCIALLLQNLGLANVPAAQGSLLLSFESVFGVVFSVMILGENLTLPMVSGFALIFASVAVSEWLPTSKLVSSARASIGKARSRKGRESSLRRMPEELSRNPEGLVPDAAKASAARMQSTHVGNMPRIHAHARYNPKVSDGIDQ